MEVRSGAGACIAIVTCIFAWASGSAAEQAAAPGAATSSDASFEVASVRPYDATGDQRRGATMRTLPSGHFEATNISLPLLIRQAHGVQLYQIVGAPAWVSADRFDVVAKAPNGFEPKRTPEMLRKLLADRFRLLAHSEVKRQSVFFLIRSHADRLGPGIRDVTKECESILAQSKSGTVPQRSGSDRGASTPGSNVGGGSANCKGTMIMGPSRIAFFANTLSAILIPQLERQAERPIIDKTGLAGLYDIELTWSSGAEGPSMFTAVEEQLGLRLQSGTADVQMFVIDRVERPTPN